MAHVVVTRQMSVPAAQVWTSLAELEHIADWNCNVSRAEMIGDERGVGARRFVWTYDDQRMVEEITQLDPATMTVASRVTEVPKPLLGMQVELRVRSTGPTSAEVVMEVEYTLIGGILGVALDTLLVRRAVRNSHAQLLEGLEHHVATGERIGDGGTRLPAPTPVAAQAS